MIRKGNIFVLSLDEETKKQFEYCNKNNFVVSSSLMPDAHSGYVAPIGSVFLTKNYIVPSWVGYDIGCGMLACKLNLNSLSNFVLKKKIYSFRDEIFEKVNKLIPMGKGNLNHINNVSKENKNEFKILLKELSDKIEINKDLLKKVRDKSISNLGTLGSGNHFIEIGFSKKDDSIWLIIHSGSRNIGHFVAEKFMKLSLELNQDNFKNEENLFNEFKNIEDKNLNFENTYELSYNSKIGKEYIYFHDFLIKFALLNRKEMMKKVELVLKEVLKDENLNFNIWTNKTHNHVIEVGDKSILNFDINNDYKTNKGENNNINKNNNDNSNLENETKYFIHRKGATSAELGERGIIPANMRDGCYLVVGKGNIDFLFSSSHGAGRKYSRKEAKELIKFEDFKNEMKRYNIKGNISVLTKDESPFVYKDINNILSLQKESIEVIDHIIPIINWKGS